MSTSFWLDRTPRTSTKTYDAVIVGAGISGLSTAYWLNQKDPSLKVALVEKSRLAFGASGRNAGFITAGSVEHFNRMISKHGFDEAVEIWRFAETNLQLLKEHVIKDQGSVLEFEQRGCYSLAAQDNEFEELKRVAEVMAGLKIPTETYGPEDLAKSVGTKNFVGGIKYLDDASVNPVKMMERLLSLVQVDFFEQTEAFRIEQLEGGTRLLKTDHGDFEAPLILLNLNGYTSTLQTWFRDKIFPTRGQCLMMEAVPRFMDGPCYANFYLDYFRQIPTGELLIGGFRQLEKETEVGTSDHTTETIQNSLHHFVMTHLPQFQNSRVTHRWSGVMGFSVDGQPMVGSLPNDPQVFFAGGYTGHGIGLAFNTAKHLVEVVFGGDTPRWLSAKRF